MRLGYNTNGLAHHSLPDAIRLLAGLGYESVAITIDHHSLNPYTENLSRELELTRALLEQVGMSSVIETGARYLLDPHCKHHPTLVSSRTEDRQRRIEFLRHAIDIAAALSSDCVSLWSGVGNEHGSSDEGFCRLTEGLATVVEYAEKKNVTLGFEPEPDMLVDTMTRFAKLVDTVASPRLALTLDVGHLHCLGEVPIADVVRQWSDRLANVHIEDMRAGVHEHLMFGEGEIDFEPVIAALAEVGYDGGLHVELSRHSHVGPAAARQAQEFLKTRIEAATAASE